MKKVFFVVCGLTMMLQGQSQKTEKEARAQLDKLCGCFNVDFKYAETFSPDGNYKFHDRDEISDALELALPIEVSDQKISIQHLLVINDSMIVKHWREDWTYENPVIWKYQGDKVWTKQSVAPDQVKGKWTQTVWEVSDEPRYQGYSPFVNMDGAVIWRSTTDAPLPRREYTVRSDYNILKRTNTLILTDTGYVHEQDNKKILRKDGTDKLLAEEKGYNTYRRLPGKECEAANKYWEKNKTYWIKVENAWEQYISTHNTVSLKTKVDNKVLHEYLFALQKEYNNNQVTESEIDGRIKANIEKFIN